MDTKIVHVKPKLVLIVIYLFNPKNPMENEIFTPEVAATSILVNIILLLFIAFIFGNHLAESRIPPDYTMTQSQVDALNTCKY